VGHNTAIMSIAFSPDGSILASGGMDNTLRFWDTATGKQRGEDIKHQGHVYSISFASDGFSMVTGSDELRLWDASEAKELRRFEVPGLRPPQIAYSFSVALSPDGRTVASGGESIATGDGYKLRLWEAATGKPRWETKVRTQGGATGIGEVPKVDALDIHSSDADCPGR